MVFTSLPLYHLDPPNWNQPNQHHQPQQPPNNESPHLISPPTSMIAQSAQNQAHGSGGGGGGSRPGSMAERARLAKIPQPEPSLKCPRCDSTNTKFCYFNNYSLSQPRHFCKTCRRYWTRGGALRSVPVGGGCRRNKRSTNSKSSSSSSNNKKSGFSSAAAASSSSCSTATSGSTVIPSNFAYHQLPFLSSSLSPLADQYGATLGLNFMQQQQHLDAGDYQMGAGGGGSSLGLELGRIQQIQQFPFLGGGLDHTSSANPMTGTIYPNFDVGEAAGGEGFHVNPSKVASTTTTTSGLITQLASVKMEDSHPHGGLSLPRQYLGIPGNDQYLGSGEWAGDLSGFNSPSSGNIL